MDRFLEDFGKAVGINPDFDGIIDLREL